MSKLTTYDIGTNVIWRNRLWHICNIFLSSCETQTVIEIERPADDPTIDCHYLTFNEGTFAQLIEDDRLVILTEEETMIWKLAN